MIKLWKFYNSGSGILILPLSFREDLIKLDEITRELPSGAYTTFRTYKHDKALRLASHLNRLEETARLEDKSVEINQDSLRDALRQVVGSYPASQELRIRIVLDLEVNPGEIYLMAEHLKTPPADSYVNGVRLVTCDMRRMNPKAKLTSSIRAADRVRENLESDIEDALMVDETGCILEGLTSNFFAIRAGQLWTNEKDVLSGITRSLVLDEARMDNLKVNFEGICSHDISTLDEAFITSSSRAILPVFQIDDQRIGVGKPGRITGMLMKRLEDRIRQEIEMI